MAKKINSDIIQQTFDNSEFQRIVNTEINELYQKEISMQQQVANLFEQYNELSDIIPLTGGDLSFNALINLIKNDTSGKGIIYSNNEQQITFNEIATIIEQNKFLTDENILLQQTLDSMGEQNNNIVLIDNNSFEKWIEANNNEGIKWSGPQAWRPNYNNINFLPVVGYNGSGSAIRLYKTVANTWEYIRNANYIKANYLQQFKFTINYRTSQNHESIIYIGDWREANSNDSDGSFSWYKELQLPSNNEQWSKKTTFFTVYKNQHNFKITKFIIKLLSGLKNDNDGWIEFDNIKLEKIPSINNVANNGTIYYTEEGTLTQEQETTYTCNICNAIFNSDTLLQQHLQEEHEA